MKKFLFISGACLILIAASMSVLIKEQLDRKLICFQTGQIIAVDRVWETAGDLYYENGKEIHAVSLADIRAIKPPSLNRALQDAFSNWPDRIHIHWNALLQFLLAPAESPWHLKPTVWVLLAAGAALPPFFLIWRRSRRLHHEENAPQPPPAGMKAEGGDLPSQADVVRFFLDLYRQQLGLGPEVPMEFFPLTAAAAEPNRVYELRVKQATDWVRRRMAIGPLGDESASRSKCYYVIFDNHLVIKIPPKPIRNFEEYVTSLRKEENIVQRLAPKKCIIPKLSVILRLIHPLPSEAEIPAEHLEDAYLTWLHKNPTHQANLRIKNTFVYFMDLSQHFFLSHIMSRFHDLDQTLQTEVNVASELFHHPSKFRERYGDRNEGLGFEIRDLYHECETEIRHLLMQSDHVLAASDYRLRDWFVSYLKNNQIPEAGAGLPPTLAEAVAAIFTRRFDIYREPVKNFRRLVHAAARRLALEQNRRPIAGLITQLLDLLAWLGMQKVAMRDLKPDNLMIAGDVQNYPAFLRSPADYSLGFIDVETAVYFGNGDANGLPQPLLGGTPYYATPSHLFPNSTLAACFGDASRVLQAQDWQAVLVMVFGAVTGKLLFDRTARCFADIGSRAAQAMRQSAPLEGVLADVSRAFWRSAAAEFREKLKAAEKPLRYVEADVSKPARALLAKALRQEIESLNAGIQKRIDTQSRLATLQCREHLRTASHDRICRIMEKLNATSQTGRNPTAVLHPELGFLKDLADLKALVESKARVLLHLESGGPCRMSAYDLLTLMFGHVLQVMKCTAENPVRGKPAAPTCPAFDHPNTATQVCSPPEALGAQAQTAVLP
jgi:serine/threonine protein kinase